VSHQWLFNEILLVKSAYGICVVSAWLLFRQFAFLVKAFLRVLQSFQSKGDRISQTHCRNYHSSALYFLDILLETVHNPLNQSADDSFRTPEPMPLVKLFFVIEDNLIRHPQSGVVSFGLSSNILKLGVVVRKVFRQLMTDQI
jgi:hypothetical protein